MPGNGNLGETPADRRERIVAACVEAFEREGPAALERFCAEIPDLASEMRAAVRTMLELRVASSSEAGSEASRIPRETIGKYLILERLAGGGMGVLFRARDTALDREVAIKILAAPLASIPGALARFHREARAIAQVRHPHVVAVHDAGETPDGLPYLVMDLIEGSSLESILRRLGGTDPKTLRADDFPAAASSAASYVEAVVRLVAKIADALEHAHRAGVIHRDVKPGNILVDRQGEPRLVDFGLARDLEASALTQTGSAPGTPYYMSPEQIAGGKAKIDARTDIYSLGATLYEALTLRRPFTGDTTPQVFRQVLWKEAARPRRLNPAIPPDLETVCLKALEKDPERRYASAGFFAEDLQSLLELRPIRARPAGPLTRTAKFVRRNPWPSALAAALLLTLLAPAGDALVDSIRTRGHIEQGSRALEGGDLEGARSEAGSALDIDPRSPAARDLLGGVAREEGRQKAERYFDIRDRLRAIRDRIWGDRVYQERENRMMLPQDRIESNREDRREEARLRAEEDRAYLEALESLHQARGFAPDHPLVTRLLSGVHLAKWRDALGARDHALAKYFREKVEENDRRGEHRDALEGRGSVSLDGSPKGAEVYLFEYVLEEEVKEGGEERLVPVPFHPDRGRILPFPADGPFHPGDLVLAVEEVEPGSPAERAGLRRGDLILEVGGESIEESVIVVGLEVGGPADRAGVRLFDRISRVAGREIRREADLGDAWLPVERGESYEAVFASDGVEKVVRASRDKSLETEIGVSLGTPRARVEAVLPREGLELTVLASDGEIREVVLSDGGETGLRVEPTACPLPLSPANRVGTLPLILSSLPPRSYLFVLRAERRENLRVPVHLEHGASLEAMAEMLPLGGTPEGFVWIPPGPFLAEGDPEAYPTVGLYERRIEGCWIGRHEVTVAEYRKFLSDPATLAEIDAAAREGRAIRVPRTLDRTPWAEGSWFRSAGRAFETSWPPDEPIRGVSWEDAEAYVRWRNRRAEERGEPWRFDLPTEEEWEKAARGVDGRKFPWGDSFHPGFCTAGSGRPFLETPGPVGRRVRSESPWGVLDMAGSVWEWCENWVVENSTRARRGGSWLDGLVQDLRPAHRHGEAPEFANATLGFRLVARLRE